MNVYFMGGNVLGPGTDRIPTSTEYILILWDVKAKTYTNRR